MSQPCIDAVPRIFISQPEPKRTTCDSCQRRKVRCDRSKPACLRCMKSRITCSYPSAEKDAARLNAILKSLSTRLAQAELQLQQKGDPGAIDGSDSECPSTISNTMDRRTSGDESLPAENCSVSMSNHVTHSPQLATWLHAEASDPSEDMLFDQPPVEYSDIQDDMALVLGQDFSYNQMPSASWMDASTFDSCDPTAMQGVSGPTEMRFEVSPDMKRQLTRRYFDVVQKHLPLVDENTFLHKTMVQDDHQSKALAYAIAMSGPSGGDDTKLAQEQCYQASRYHLERAEMECNNSSFLNLESAQALVLVVRYEASNLDGPRAMITLSRLAGLLSCLRRSHPENQPEEAYTNYDASSSLSRSSDEPGLCTNRDYSRRTFWVAYSLQNIIAVSQLSTIVRPIIEIGPDLSLPKPNTLEALKALDDFSLFVVAMELPVQTEEHRQHTIRNVARTGSPDYNFCRVHEQIEGTIGLLIATLANGSRVTVEHHSNLRVLALLVTLASRISVYESATINAQKADYMHSLIDSCQRVRVAAANAICDVIIQAGVLSPNLLPEYKAMSLFIMGPLAIAAKVLLEALRSGQQELGSNWYYTNRELRHSLENITTAMRAIQNSKAHHEPLLKDCRTFLESGPLRSGLSEPRPTSTNQIYGRHPRETG